MLILATLLAAAALAPSATTGAPSDVTRTSATLNGTVDPHGTAATYHFEYGTTTAYGLATPEAPAGDGDGAAPVHAAVSGLSGSTTYHVRLVATGEGGTSQGSDRTFSTAADPRPPGVSSTTTAAPPASRAVTLRTTIDPNGATTTYRFDYGRTTAYGSHTPTRTAPGEDGATVLTESLDRLVPNRRYHYRVTATNAAGTTRSTDHSFVTDREPTAVTLTLDAAAVPWNSGAEAFGRVSGTSVGGIVVGLERQDFPYAGPFSSLGLPLPVHADSHGNFRIPVPPLFSTTRLRAVTRNRAQIASPVVTLPVKVSVGAAVRRVNGKRVKLRGAVRPAAPQGRAVLQRRTSHGAWSFVRGADLIPLSGNRSRYAFTVARRHTVREFRVRVVARDGGAHYPGTSRTVSVPAAKRPAVSGPAAKRR